MMRRLALDFNRRASPVTPTAILVLLGGAGLALFLHTDWEEVRDKVSRLDSQLARLIQSSNGTAVVKPSLTDAQRGEVVRAQTTIRQLTTPWDAILGALEAGLDDDVVLIAVDSDARRNVVSLTAEARNARAMLAYLDHLATTPLLGNPVLTGHQEQEQIAERPIRFTFQVDWRPAAAGMAAHAARDES